jgi:hypothetical protein
LRQARGRLAAWAQSEWSLTVGEALMGGRPGWGDVGGAA